MVRYRELVETVDLDQINVLFREHFVCKAKYKIDKNGLITVNGSCRYISDGRYKQLPVKFAKTNEFNCSFNGLESLTGSPRIVNGDFNCQGNYVSSLLDGPTFVQRQYYCASNLLHSLDGIPASLHEGLDCSYNNLSSLKGLDPDMKASITCKGPLISLEGLPNLPHFVHITYNSNLPLLRLVGVMDSGNQGRHISVVGCEPVDIIVRKYRNQANPSNLRQMILACQKELIDAGFEGNASW